MFEVKHADSSEADLFWFLNYRYHIIFFTVMASVILIMSILSIPLSKQSVKKEKGCPKNELQESKKEASFKSGFSRLDSAIDVQDSDLTDVLNNLKENPDSVSDEMIISLLDAGKIAGYSLEKTLGDFTRAVKIRRRIICNSCIVTNKQRKPLKAISHKACYLLIIMTTQRFLVCVVKM